MSTKSNNRNNATQKYKEQENYVPFESVEEAWFWFIAAQQARNDGARYVSGFADLHRPCEPVDILKALDSLYRKRRLLRDHLLVLRHYGKRFMAPDPRRVKEQRSFYLWREAMDRLGLVLEKKGIVVSPLGWAGQQSFSFFEERAPL